MGGYGVHRGWVGWMLLRCPIGQHSDDCNGLREWLEVVESPSWCICRMIAFPAAIFAWFLSSFWPPSRARAAYHLGRCGKPLHDAVGVNCKQGATTHIKAQVPNIWSRSELKSSEIILVVVVVVLVAVVVVGQTVLSISSKTLAYDCSCMQTWIVHGIDDCYQLTRTFGGFWE